jgi:hypothetical protein
LLYFTGVGDKEFVLETKAKLGAKAIDRRELENNEGYELKETQPVGSSCPVVARRAKSEAKPKVLTTVFLTLKSAA